MSFTLRVDLESQKGISKGLPNLLDLLAKHGIKASFYLTMGGESNIFEILKYRGAVPGAGERSINVFSFMDKLRMAIHPIDFVKKNKSLLKRILKEGHELGIHGWKHRRWTRGLEKIDVDRDVKLAISKYVSLFGKNPDSFCSPAFRTNQRVVDVLDARGIKFVSDFFAKVPAVVGGTKMVNVPVTIKGEMNTPIIEHLVTKGYSDDAIFEYLVENIEKKKFSVMYVHGMYECIEKIDLLDRVFTFVKTSGIEVKTIRQVANENITDN
ncbi:polysaccharide deacetylase family protein [Candidatus Woesearchaeota archaeon]|jgi:undecaprenyl phosphate-alpha-L-ara4FN deformylase|nr:polysaccharide deacetylase family protein [Candidatus Woesearchaeota archaeon]MBT6044740.1 polysaccharide deacetylase family protein [Candidatus Woesearchaeota archaeon]